MCLIPQINILSHSRRDKARQGGEFVLIPLMAKSYHINEHFFTMANKCCSVKVWIFARYVQCWKGYIGNKPRYCNLLCGLCSKVHRDLLFLWEISKLAKNPAHLDSDLGVVMDDNDDDLYVMENNDDATQFDVCLGAESPLSANLTKLPNLSLPQLQSVNLARFDLNIRCARRPPLHKFHHKCKFGLYLM